MYDFYNGDDDPRLHESDITTKQDIETLNPVECSNGCGFWRGDNLDNGKCPECGDECYDVDQDEYPDEDESDS
ncbi:hypothetical protein [Vibrio sp. D431a]|uniref:hypothetical protein n=1 Tax=Vibrio sp. D431a TaxID=2837388 RepID=UPI0025532D3E|nr:hypothetical protein [Vibrio sp. D431a]MDK9789750.1 hypothetical protein [Vibrio sp. D431a]